MSGPFRVAYGVTTCELRLHNEDLRKTLASLAKAGFDSPRVFIDGVNSVASEEVCAQFSEYTLRRGKPAGPYGSWVSAMWELVTRDPDADRFVMFQDDVIVSAHLRDFLSACEYPTLGYCNLCTYPKNAERPHAGVGWYPSNQLGLGAQALMFSNAAVTALLSSPHLISRVTSKNPAMQRRRWKFIDGAVVEAMRPMGYREFVHDPSLVYHIGDISAKAHYNPLDEVINPQPETALFRGEDFDLRTLLK